MIEFVAGILMGIAGALHCVGMCGPLVALAATSSKQQAPLFSILQYHSGRILIYIIIAAALSLTRNLFVIGSVSNIVSISAGLVMITSAILQIGYHRSLLPTSIARPITAVVARYNALLTTSRPVGMSFVRGVVNGFLPCGLSLSAFIASITLPQLWQVVVFMTGFGVGTMPGLVGVMAAGAYGSTRLSSLRSVGPILVIVSGVLLLLRGLSLGIPWLSPEINHAMFHTHSGCCSAE